eukprot:gene42953-43399_t
MAGGKGRVKEVCQKKLRPCRWGEKALPLLAAVRSRLVKGLRVAPPPPSWHAAHRAAPHSETSRGNYIANGAAVVAWAAAR